MSRTRLPLLFVLLLALAATPERARSAVSVVTGGNTASASISLAGGIEADLSLGFSNAQNLSVQSLGIDADLVSTGNLALLARLPDANLVSIPAAFPMLLTIEPPSLGGLAFEDTVRVELHTHDLSYVPGSRLRLFKAPLGGAFVDITEAVEAGSVRTRGRTGGFSQFLVLLDLRPTSSVVELKFDALDDRLADATGLDSGQRAALEGLLVDARDAYELSDLSTAIAAVEQFDAEVRLLAGTALANDWRALRDLDNHAGELQAGAATLRFSLEFLRDHGN